MFFIHGLFISKTKIHKDWGLVVGRVRVVSEGMGCSGSLGSEEFAKITLMPLETHASSFFPLGSCGKRKPA